MADRDGQEELRLSCLSLLGKEKLWPTFASVLLLVCVFCLSGWSGEEEGRALPGLRIVLAVKTPVIVEKEPLFIVLLACLCFMSQSFACPPDWLVNQLFVGSLLLLLLLFVSPLRPLPGFMWRDRERAWGRLVKLWCFSEAVL